MSDAIQNLQASALSIICGDTDIVFDNDDAGIAPMLLSDCLVADFNEGDEYNVREQREYFRRRTMNLLGASEEESLENKPSQSPPRSAMMALKYDPRDSPRTEATSEGQFESEGETVESPYSGNREVMIIEDVPAVSCMPAMDDGGSIADSLTGSHVVSESPASESPEHEEDGRSPDAVHEEDHVSNDEESRASEAEQFRNDSVPSDGELSNHGEIPENDSSSPGFGSSIDDDELNSVFVDDPTVSIHSSPQISFCSSFRSESPVEVAPLDDNDDDKSHVSGPESLPSVPASLSGDWRNGSVIYDLDTAKSEDQGVVVNVVDLQNEPAAEHMPKEEEERRSIPSPPVSVRTKPSGEEEDFSLVLSRTSERVETVSTTEDKESNPSGADSLVMRSFSIDAKDESSQPNNHSAGASKSMEELEDDEKESHASAEEQPDSQIAENVDRNAASTEADEQEEPQTPDARHGSPNLQSGTPTSVRDFWKLSTETKTQAAPSSPRKGEQWGEDDCKAVATTPVSARKKALLEMQSNSTGQIKDDPALEEASATPLSARRKALLMARSEKQDSSSEPGASSPMQPRRASFAGDYRFVTPAEADKKAALDARKAATSQWRGGVMGEPMEDETAVNTRPSADDTNNQKSEARGAEEEMAPSSADTTQEPLVEMPRRHRPLPFRPAARRLADSGSAEGERPMESSGSALSRPTPKSRAVVTGPVGGAPTDFWGDDMLDNNPEDFITPSTSKDDSEDGKKEFLTFKPVVSTQAAAPLGARRAALMASSPSRRQTDEEDEAIKAATLTPLQKRQESLAAGFVFHPPTQNDDALRAAAVTPVDERRAALIASSTPKEQPAEEDAAMKAATMTPVAKRQESLAADFIFHPHTSEDDALKAATVTPVDTRKAAFIAEVSPPARRPMAEKDAALRASTPVRNRRELLEQETNSRFQKQAHADDGLEAASNTPVNSRLAALATEKDIWIPSSEKDRAVLTSSPPVGSRRAAFAASLNGSRAATPSSLERDEALRAATSQSVKVRREQGRAQLTKDTQRSSRLALAIKAELDALKQQSLVSSRQTTSNRRARTDRLFFYLGQRKGGMTDKDFLRLDDFLPHERVILELQASSEPYDGPKSSFDPPEEGVTLRVWLMCPQEKIFEIVTVELKDEMTVEEVVQEACDFALDPVLSDQHYVSLCNMKDEIVHPSALVEPLLRLSPTKRHQTLMAVPFGSTALLTRAIRRVLEKKDQVKRWLRQPDPFHAKETPTRRHI